VYASGLGHIRCVSKVFAIAEAVRGRIDKAAHPADSRAAFGICSDGS